MESTTLNSIATGQSATILKVGGDGPFRRRLLELGLTPGQDLKVLKIAPMGDPLELKVRGGRLSIRRNEAKTIVVEAGAKRATIGLRELLSPIRGSTA